MLQTPDNNTENDQANDQAHSYSGGIRTLPRLSTGQHIKSRFTHSEHGAIPDSAVPDSVIHGQTCATTEQEVMSPGYPNSSSKKIFHRFRGDNLRLSKTDDNGYQA